MMHGTIQKWGNSQAIRFPKAALQTAQLKENDEVEIIASAEAITIRKVKKYRSLDELFAGYQGDYRPEEMDIGEPVGREVLE